MRRALLALLLLVGCGSGASSRSNPFFGLPPTPPALDTPYSIHVISGDGQTGQLGARLLPLGVIVTDYHGRPVDGVPVHFAGHAYGLGDTTTGLYQPGVATVGVSPAVIGSALVVATGDGPGWTIIVSTSGAPVGSSSVQNYTTFTVCGTP